MFEDDQQKTKLKELEREKNRKREFMRAGEAYKAIIPTNSRLRRVNFENAGLSPQEALISASSVTHHEGEENNLQTDT